MLQILAETFPKSDMMDPHSVNSIFPTPSPVAMQGYGRYSSLRERSLHTLDKKQDIRSLLFIYQI